MASSPEETYQGNANAMSSENKTPGCSKPVAMAIPKGGVFEDNVEQARYGPIKTFWRNLVAMR
jgi:hypothetical protein